VNMVAERQILVPASYLAGASCQLPAHTERRRGKSRRAPIAGVETGDHRKEALLARLTPAEQRMAELVAQGLSNKEISSALGRAGPTIKHQLSSAMRKIGVQSRCQLIVRLLT